MAILLLVSLLLPAGDETRPEPRRIGAPGGRAAASEPSAAGVAGWTVLVLGLIAAAAFAARKGLRGSALLAPAGGAIELLGRRPLGARQELYLVAIGTRVLLVGSTKESLVTLGEFPRDGAPPVAPGEPRT